jgi:hypothetical protein
MKKIIQRTLTGEEASLFQKVEPLTVTELIWLPIVYIYSKITLQRALYLSAFSTYGIGDGVTAAYMMDNIGVMREANPLARMMYMSNGKQGIISLKLWFALVILFIVWVASRKTGIYWTINGFLFALTMGGAMAMRANVMATLGMAPPSPGSIIMTFLFMVVLLVMIGDIVDKLHADRKNHA